MDDIETVDSFASLFTTGYAQQPDRIVQRKKAEKRAGLSDRQRKRGAVRTAQINFRCSPEFKNLAVGLAKHSDASIADIMEEALTALAKAKKFKGSE